MQKQQRVELMAYIYILATILLTVYGQLVIKWQVDLAGELPPAFESKIIYILRLLFNPWVISGFISAFFAAISWMMALSKLPLSYTYPFTSLSFVLVPFIGVFVFKEAISIQQIIGLFFVVLGVVIGSQR